MLEVGSKVGPFTVGEVIGRGGMATVYQAHHAVDDHPVAVKVLRADIPFDADFNAAFQEEVRSAAKLDHPRITSVYDYGIIAGSSDEQRSPSDTSWLAMELVQGGTISSLAGRASWAKVRGVLLDVLDALAHAHARGLIHRDIKPANVLLDRESGRIKLTDFGLAHSVDFFSENGEPGGALFDTDQITGTPSYMAPEQITNQWRSFGPWTDLYAVGVLAWTLAAGRPPYRGDVNQIFDQHLSGKLPVFSPHTAMPLEFIDWIDAMMSVKPSNRFKRAADAAWALSRIQFQISDDDTQVFMRSPAPPVSDVPSVYDPNMSTQQVMKLDTLMLNTQETSQLSRSVETLLLPDDGRDVNDLDTGGPSPMLRVTPPFPSSWGETRRRRVHIHGAGLALFGLRATGVVGREPERDRLWASMKTVIRQQRTKLVMLEGASGSGKSTLAQWFCQRVDEVGVGMWRFCTHTSEDGPNDGIGSMLRQHFRILGLEREAAIKHAAMRLRRVGIDSPEDAAGLVELSSGSSQEAKEQGLGAVFSGREEVFALLSRFLQAQARSRPLILWLDELQHGEESQALARYLVELDTQAPILILTTVSAEAVTAGSETETKLNALLDTEHAEKIELSPLGWAEQVKLMSELLGLESGLATEVATKCGGNPQFAVQIVGNWVEQGMLVPGEHGFELRDGCDASVPSNLFAVWDDRLGDLIAHHKEEALWALEIGAVLGNNVDRGEWSDALEAAGLEPPDGLLSELLRLRLIVREDAISNWSFVHALFRESVLKHAQSRGRIRQWSSICADVIRNEYTHLARWARLLVAGGRSEEALRPLQDAVYHEVLIGESGRAKTLDRLRTQIIETMDIEPGGVLDLGTHLCSYYQIIAADHLSDEQYMNGLKLLDWARRVEDWSNVAVLHQRVGSLSIARGDFQAAESHMTAAIHVAKKHRLDSLPVVLRGLCFFHLRKGDLTEAFGYARECVIASERMGSIHSVGKGYGFMARVKRQAGELEAATFFLDEALVRHELIGARAAIADVWNTRGEIARAKGDLEAAEHAYTVAVESYQAVGKTGIYAKINLCMTYVDGGKYSETEILLTDIERRIQGAPRREVESMCQLLRVACRVSIGDWSAVRTGLTNIKSELTEIGLVDIDIATTARTIAHGCESAGESALAVCAWQIASAQFLAMGREKDLIEAKVYLSQHSGSVHV